MTETIDIEYLISSIQLLYNTDLCSKLRINQSQVDRPEKFELHHNSSYTK